MKTFLIIVILNSPGLPHKAFEFPTEKACEAARVESLLPKGSPALTFCAPSATPSMLTPGIIRRHANT